MGEREKFKRSLPDRELDLDGYMKAATGNVLFGIAIGFFLALYFVAFFAPDFTLKDARLFFQHGSILKCREKQLTQPVMCVVI